MAKKNPLKEAAIRLYNGGNGWPIWKIANQLKVSESTVVKWVRK